MHSRAHIRLDTTSSIADFVKILNSDGSIDKYVIENFDSSSVVNARSYLGVLYMSVEYNDNMYLVNLTNDGTFPYEINNFRA